MSIVTRFIKELQKRRVKRNLAEIAIIGEDVHVASSFRCRHIDNPDARPVKIGNHVWLDGRFVIGDEGRIVIGDCCSFRKGTHIGSLYSVEIGSHVFGATGVYIFDHNSHPISPRARWEMTSYPPDSPLWKWDHVRISGAPVLIEDCVWLGRYCMVLKGVTIGRGSIVAAGAVVTKSIPPFSIAAGNPARVVKMLENDLEGLADTGYNN